MNPDRKPSLVIAGASGFVGRALAPLLTERFEVIGLSRSDRDGGDGFAEYRKCDLFSLKEAEHALEGAEYAVYLVHNMMPSAKLTQGDFADLDLVCADNFARAAARAGIKQIIFLGGLCPRDGSLSKHLESRVEVERVLGGHGVPVTTLRAGLILGGAGSSFQIMARLVQRLPVMVCPRWTNTRTQAVALIDVVRLIDYVVGREEHYSQVYDVSAPEVVTYRKLMTMTADALGKRRAFIPARVMSPGLSRLWVSLMTGAPRALVAPLVQSLKHEMVAGDSSLAEAAGLPRTPIREAIARAVAEDNGASPHAFQGPTGRNRQRFVRSVQRMNLPESWTAERAALDYVRWLPRFLRGLLRIRRESGEDFSFVLVPLGLTLLTLTHSADRSSADRQLFHVTGGALAKANTRARFELRQVLGGRTLLTVVHDYEPTLPWFMYVFTQSQFHKWLMHRFSAHLSHEPALVEAATNSPKALPF
jgi:uncharacterized protein YbjT (DUF2867 family)